MSQYLIDEEELKAILKLYNQRVIKNTEIVTPDTLKQENVYHISFDKRLKFFPNISKRAGMSEDNTVPRIHTAPTLMGCWFGYGTGGDLAANYSVDDSKKKVPANAVKIAPYKGGFYIHEIPFRAALKPNTELVYDADLTDEIWLVTYNQFTKDYKANVIGMLFAHSVSYYPRTGTTPRETVTLCVKIEKGKKIPFSLNNKYVSVDKKNPEFLTEGFWMFDIDYNEYCRNLRKITEKEFNDNKLLSAGMLSFQ